MIHSQDGPDEFSIGPVHSIPIIEYDDPRFEAHQRARARDAAVADALHTAEELQGGFQHESEGVRWRVVDRLVARGRNHPETLPTLAKALAEDASAIVRSTVAMALSEFDSPLAREALVAALHDTDDEVRDSARFSLAQLSSDDSDGQ